jgi:hypothetical protein
MVAAAEQISYRFRDAKGNVARMTVVIGDTTPTTIHTDSGTLKTHLQAISNAHVSEVDTDYTDQAYGTAANYLDVEDKLVLSFNLNGVIHRFQVPAPITGVFLADQETADSTVAALASVITDFQTFVYARDTAISGPMGTFLGGIRIRRKLHRKLTIRNKNPALTGPGE